MRCFRIVCAAVTLTTAIGFGAQGQTTKLAPAVAPLSIGQTFTLQSKVLGETRRINVYLPPAYTDSATLRLPVLYMPDGGLQEDFLHVAGLVQVSVGNGTMRPFILVGIENTARRRDMTGPTTNAEDKKIAPKVGGSAAFRQFIRQELMPAVKQRYRTTAETAIVGESLAGLFVVETLLLEPSLFNTYLAFDPSRHSASKSWSAGFHRVPGYQQPGRYSGHAPHGAGWQRHAHRSLALRADASGNARHYLSPGSSACLPGRFQAAARQRWLTLTH